jgi:DNA-binding NtrC family response regulator
VAPSPFSGGSHFPRLHEALKAARGRIHILGKRKAILDVMMGVRKLAALGESVLIRGESGTGKELITGNLNAFSEIKKPVLGAR